VQAVCQCITLLAFRPAVPVAKMLYVTQAYVTSDQWRLTIILTWLYVACVNFRVDPNCLSYLNYTSNISWCSFIEHDKMLLLSEV
jgi:hypothetical protein